MLDLFDTNEYPRIPFGPRGRSICGSRARGSNFLLHMPTFYPLAIILLNPPNPYWLCSEAGAYTCSPQKSWDCTYTLGEFAFIYKCLVECYWDSHWRMHRACIGKHKFTHWVETGLIYWQWAKSDDQALTLLAYKTVVYEAFWSTNFLSSADFRALTLPLRS